MAGLKGNVAWILAAKQTAKGSLATPTASNAYKNGLTGGDIGPTRETDNLSETDASRDQGDTYVVTSGAEGSPEIYVRDKSIGFWLFAALGADAPTGTMPNFTHAITPSNSIPYISVWKMLGDTLHEQFADMKVGSLNISAEAGQPLTATIGLVGRGSTRLTAAIDNASPIAVDSGAVYNFNNAAVTLGGGATALVRSFDLSIENNVTAQQTDDSIPYDVVEGQRVISLGFDLIFESLDEYNKFHYGGAAGTTQSPDVFSTSSVFTFTKGVNNEIAFNLPKIAYQEFPIEPDAGGDPVVASVRAVAQRNTPILTATVKNQVATY
jgi:hypothetical protein